jgi:2',3'-cyclic-nucleotide 2'-phosphodiesterase (5'-nucleotidase family)
VATYDLARPSGARLVSLSIGGKPVDDAKTYRVATNSFLAQGGDLYATFPRCTKVADSGALLSAVVTEHLRAAKGAVGLPRPGRLVAAPGSASR